MSKQLVVLLSRQRSGTNAYRAVMGSHHQLYCYEEVLNPDSHYLEHPWSYFNYIRKNCTADDLHPVNQLNVFADFVNHLHSLHDKPYTLIDLKYNTCAHVSCKWRPMAGRKAMPIFNWIMDNEIPTVRLSRANYLRVALSNEIAEQRQKWHDRNGEPPNDHNVNLLMNGITGWFQQMKAWELEDQLISAQFDGYDRILELEYSEIFPRLNQPIGPHALEATATLLGISNEFNTETWCRKSTNRPMWESITNWQEVVNSLKNTTFAEMLEDEPMYRGVSEVISDNKKVKLETAGSMLRRLSA